MESYAVHVTFENLSDVSIFVFEAQNIDGDVSTGEPRNQPDPRTFLRSTEVPSKSALTQTRSVGSRLRFWTADGQAAFANFDDENDNEEDAVSGGDSTAKPSRRPFRSSRLTLDAASLTSRPVPIGANAKRSARILLDEFSGRRPSVSFFEGRPLRASNPSQSESHVQFFNRSSQVAVMFTYNDEGVRVCMGKVPARSNVAVRTRANVPWMFVDEDGERMIATSEKKSSSSTIFFSPAWGRSLGYLRVELRIDASSLKELSTRLLRKLRQPNGFEWRPDQVPSSLVEDFMSKVAMSRLPVEKSSSRAGHHHATTFTSASILSLIQSRYPVTSVNIAGSP